jgi:hypothetical protein
MSVEAKECRCKVEVAGEKSPFYYNIIGKDETDCAFEAVVTGCSFDFIVKSRRQKSASKNVFRFTGVDCGHDKAGKEITRKTRVTVTVESVATVRWENISSDWEG